MTKQIHLLRLGNGSAVRMKNSEAGAPPHPGFGEALRVWFAIGVLSFGGPAGQIALMHRMLVEEKRWISESRFLHALNYCMLLPGPEAQQLATYVGWLLHGWRGGIAAGALFVLPGLAVMLALSLAYALFHQTGWLEAVFFGLKAAVLAIVVDAVIRVGRRALKNGLMVTIAALAFLALFVFSVPFPIVVLSAGVFGYFGTRLRPDLLAPSRAHAAAAPDAPSVIGEDWRAPAEPPLAVLRTGLVWAAVWAAPLVLVVPLFGWQSSFAAIMAFFSQMAVVTFGGAYAVLAYVAQQAVEAHGWLAPGEMLDGLALAETTPGPLVLVLTFVGFLAGFRAPMGLDPVAGGLLGGFLAAWVTFVPSFLWIFLGAPFMERLRDNRPLSGALSAITAAVVGVILNLAIWFGLHVVFRSIGDLSVGPMRLTWPDWTSLDPAALVLSLAAGVLLVGFRFGIVPVLALTGAAGFALQLLG